jgi:hypothetical protein
LQCCCDLLRWRLGFKAQNRRTSLLPSCRLLFFPPLSTHTIYELISSWNAVANTPLVSHTNFKILRQPLHKVREHVSRAYRRSSHLVFELLPVYHHPRSYFSATRDSFSVANISSALSHSFDTITHFCGKLWLYLQRSTSPLAQPTPASRSDKTYHHKQKLILCLL